MRRIWLAGLLIGAPMSANATIYATLQGTAQVTTVQHDQMGAVVSNTSINENAIVKIICASCDPVSTAVYYNDTTTSGSSSSFYNIAFSFDPPHPYDNIVHSGNGYGHVRLSDVNGIGQVTTYEEFTFTQAAAYVDSSTPVNTDPVVTFSALATPEPAIWAMMVLGMGAIGVAMRGRKDNMRVSFAA